MDALSPTVLDVKSITVVIKYPGACRAPTIAPFKQVWISSDSCLGLEMSRDPIFKVLVLILMLSFSLGLENMVLNINCSTGL